MSGETTLRGPSLSLNLLIARRSPPPDPLCAANNTRVPVDMPPARRLYTGRRQPHKSRRGRVLSRAGPSRSGTTFSRIKNCAVSTTVKGTTALIMCWNRWKGQKYDKPKKSRNRQMQRQSLLRSRMAISTSCAYCCQQKGSTSIKP